MNCFDSYDYWKTNDPHEAKMIEEESYNDCILSGICPECGSVDDNVADDLICNECKFNFKG
jgi:hypothetical protein